MNSTAGTGVSVLPQCDPNFIRILLDCSVVNNNRSAVHQYYMYSGTATQNTIFYSGTRTAAAAGVEVSAQTMFNTPILLTDNIVMVSRDIAWVAGDISTHCFKYIDIEV